jgi:hypothetical protein
MTRPLASMASSGLGSEGIGSCDGSGGSPPSLVPPSLLCWPPSASPLADSLLDALVSLAPAEAPDSVIVLVPLSTASVSPALEQAASSRATVTAIDATTADELVDELADAIVGDRQATGGAWGRWGSAGDAVGWSLAARDQEGMGNLPVNSKGRG